MSGTVFHKWLIGDLGTPGEYQYQTIHWCTTAAVVLVFLFVLLFGFLHRKKPQYCRGLLVGICVFQLAFEVLWRLIFLFIKGDSILCWWPMYPCNLGGLLLPVIALCRWQRGKQIFYLFGFVGGVLSFALPEGIFCTDVFVFPILKSVLQHTGLLMIPALELVTGTYRPTLRDIGWIITGCLIHLLNCEGIDRLLGFTGDYMFLRSGMPFVLPGVPQFITISVFALIVLSALSFLCDIPGSIRFLKQLHKKLLK